MDTKKYYQDYAQGLKKLLDDIDYGALAAATDELISAFQKGKTIFVAGNGGSAGTASHFACDLCKTTLGKKPLEAKVRLKCIALTDNMPLMTAYGNDTAYVDVFAEPLRTLGSAGDCLVVITASGNSPNILAVLEAAKEMGIKTVGFLGFAGGKSKALVDHVCLAPSEHYGMIEDAHSIFMHMVTDRLKVTLAEAQPA